jgi:hypothetical protein
VKKASTKFSVNIQGGEQDELYFTAEQPTYEAVLIEGSVPSTFVNYIVLKPQNGYPRGQVLRVPIERLIWISEESEDE